MKTGSGPAGSLGREPAEPDIDDRRLVSAYLRSRDEAAFRALFRRHTPALYLLALRLEGGRSSEADDVVQEAWVRAIARLSAFEWRSALRTWLAGFVVRCSRELRRRPVTASLDDEIVGLDEAHPDARLDLERALRGLPDGYREVVVLHDCEGWTHAEIGHALKIDAGTSKSQLSRGRRALRRFFEGTHATAVRGGHDGTR